MAATPATLETLANQLEFHDRILSDEHQQFLGCARDWAADRTSMAELLAALKSIAGVLTWNECAQATPQVRLTKAEISNALDSTVGFARAAIAKAEGKS